MKKSLTLVLLYLLAFLRAEASEQKLVEIPGTQVIPIQDTQSKRQYELYIKLPKKYSENNDIKYPVMYLTDGISNFEKFSSPAGALVKDIILVGISWQKDIDEDLKKEVGEHVSRFRDYSIRKSSDPEHQSKYQFGQADNHLAFIRNDVIKYVENNYRADPNRRTYFGYSLGGNFGAYVLLTQPDTFKNYILGSPSLWRDVPHLFTHENGALKRKDLNVNVFISYGSLEETQTKHVEEFITTLKKRNYKGLSSLQRVVIESADHGTAPPMTVIHSLNWLLGLRSQS